MKSLRNRLTKIATVKGHLRRLINRSIGAWLSIAALILVASIQPSASALEFPMVGRVVLPDSAALTAVPITTEALFTQLRTKALVSSDEIAQASLESARVEMARTQFGAQTVAKTIMAEEYDWNTYQFGCLKTLWTYESHWNYRAHNYSSGAHGIPQALPASKMETIATDWRTNPLTQIRWGLHYIDVRYDTPCRALSKFGRSNSY
ncbi:MAG TPA: hypothetical protein VMW30_01430 [Candidatus Paceibacterota bacterium]|nr:hypothetical protein [Candidatus Paceibacterota bacterium]